MLTKTTHLASIFYEVTEMKRIFAILLSLILIITLLPQTTFAEENLFKLSPEQYDDGEKFWKVNDFYLVRLALYDFETDVEEVYLMKTEEPYAYGDEEYETKIIDFAALAKDIGGFDRSMLAPYGPVLSDGHVLYAVVDAEKDADGGTAFDIALAKISLDEPSHEVIPLNGYAANMPQLCKVYKGNVYFGANVDKLFVLGKNGKITRVAASLGDVSGSQSNSNSKYVYGFSPKGFYGTLKVFNLATKKSIKTVNGVRGYYATNSKLYYAKKEKSLFKVYEAKAAGSSPKLIYKLKNKSVIENRISKVTSSSIYYVSVDTDNGKFTYYKYNRKTKKRSTISYMEYVKATSDYAQGYQPVDDYYNQMMDDEEDDTEGDTVGLTGY